MKDWSDRRLVSYAQRHGEMYDTFSVLYVRYHPWSRRYARGFVNDADSWDITDEAFLYLWRRIPRLHSPYRVQGVLRRAVRHRALDFIRRQKRCDLCDPVDFDRIEAEPTAFRFAGHDTQEIWRQVEIRLNGREFRVLAMRVRERMGFAEIASIERLSRGGVRCIFRRAKEKIRSSKTFCNVLGF